MPRKPRVPAYCLHRPTGQAYCRVEGKFHYLGEYGSAESRERYGRLIAEKAGASPVPAATRDEPKPAITISELCLAYWKHAEGYYRKGDRTTGELHPIRIALRHLREIYGSSIAAEFGPLAMRALQRHLVQKGMGRTTINALMRRVRSLFKWGASMELVPVEVYQAIATVPPYAVHAAGVFSGVRNWYFKGSSLRYA
jgi:hypothetical protein